MWRFLVLFWGLCSIASAQNLTIKSVEWSVEPNYSTAKISAKAFINLSDVVKDSVTLILKAEKVHEVRLWEGRLKQALPFKQKNGKLHIKATGHKSLFISYTIDTKDAAHVSLSNIDQNGIALNTSVASGLGSLPEPGLWYPEDYKRIHDVKLNILLPSNWDVRIAWPHEYSVDNGNATAHFYQREAGSLETFFLLAGDFAKMQLPELLEEVQLSYTEKVQIFGEQLKTRHKAFLEYSNLTNISQKDIYIADSIAATSSQDIFPLNLDFYNDPENKLYQTLLLQQNDSLEASLQLYRFLNRNTEPSLIAEELATDSFSSAQLFVWLNYYLKDYNLTLADTSGSFTATKTLAALQLAKTVWHTQKVPSAALQYRFANGAMQVHIEKDALLNGIRLPLNVSYVINNKRTDESRITDKKLLDTISISSSGAPYLIYAQKTPLTPIRIVNHLPDNYWLYLLANGSDREKRSALSALFQTTNTNLKATVIGIALDDADPRIRVKALEHAGELNISGQKRLESTLKTLQTEDPNPQVQDLAKEWVEKYYAL